MEHYSKQWWVFRDKRITAEIETLDPVKDHCRIVKLMAVYEFPWDVVRAMEVTLIRMFCSPSISGLLHRTGEFKKHGQKRYDDTGLLMAEFMQDGYDGERGKRAINHINKIHSYYKIRNEDYLFVLSTFVFVPAQWIDTYGWRKITENERQALFYFFMQVGIRMNIEVPGTLAGLEKFVEEYEKNNFMFKETNQALANATVNIVKSWMPFFVKPFVLPVMKCVLDEKMLKVLGYTPSPAWLKSLFNGVMSVRALSLRRVTLQKYPWYFTEEPNRTYPHGYDIEELGPEHVVKKFR